MSDLLDKLLKKANPAPEWAKCLIEDVCDAYNVPVPNYKWFIGKRQDRLSTGWAYHHTSPYADRGIKINAGTEEAEQKIVLLHELSHWIGMEQGEHHNAKFWRRAFELYETYGDIQAAIERECWRAGAHKEAKRKGHA